MLTLVTGGTGMVGYNIIRTLLHHNRPVRALVRSLDKGKRLLPAECELVQGDITDIASIRQAMQGCSVVYHAAGFPEQWMKDTAIFDRINVQGTQNMIDVALEQSVQRFIYTSTIDVFAAQQGASYDESVIDPHPKGTFYERSKQQADIRVTQALLQGLPAVFLHPSGVYGEGPTDSPGTNDLILKLHRKEIPVLLPGGLPLVYAADVGLGHYLAEQKAAVGARYILSEGYYPLAQLAKTILDLLGNPYKVPRVMPYMAGKVLAVLGEWWAAISNRPPLIPKGQLTFLQWQATPISRRAQQELLWQPTPLLVGLEKTMSYLGILS